jgi:hypothetical protein
MMDDNQKEFTRKLSDILLNKTLKFILEIFESNKAIELQATPLLNIVLSSHVSSLLNIMPLIAGDNENIKKNINEFLNKLTLFIEDFTNKKIEVIRFR